MSPKSALEQIHMELAGLSAAEAADLFLSPHIDPSLLREATVEPGPSLWIVNRSDVYDETLEAMSLHEIQDMAERATEKLKNRRSTFQLLQPPEVDVPWNQIDEHSIEDVLGHPLVNLEAVLFFSQHRSDDVRASSALSLTRRYLEHRPNFESAPEVLRQLQNTFSKMLLDDLSPYVRGYAARVPLLPESIVGEALRREHHPFVKAKILQNPALHKVSLIQFGDRDWSEEEPVVSRIYALDSRVPAELRSQIFPRVESGAEAIHSWYLGRKD